LKGAEITTPYVNKLAAAIDNYLELTGISHIVMRDEGKEIITNMANNIKIRTEELAGKKLTYDQFQSMRKSVMAAYDNIIDVAKKDLRDDNV
jgi:hypothetical protein